MQRGYLIYLYAALGLITLLVILTRGKPALARRKVFLGLLILSLTASTAAMISCKSGSKKIVQKDVWQTEGWFDNDTYRIYSSGIPRDGLTNKIQRKGTAKESAILYAQKMVLERFKPVQNQSCAGMADYGYYENPYVQSKELLVIIKAGRVIAERFDEMEKCEIMYEVKSAGLKEMVLGPGYDSN